MKAFSSSILSESTHTNSGISIVDENRVISLLEQDEMLLAKEVEKKRAVFVDLVHATLHEYGCVSEETRHEFDTWTDTHKHREALNESTIDPYTDDEAGYFREMDDTLTRYRIAVKEYESTAIGQEAMIFVSETTDTEKFEKLQAVNEAIGAKVKKVFYNTIAKIKELFAKFMEKLRGNFTTTKNYLDRYKDIILKKPFSDDRYESKNLPDMIDSIWDISVRQLDLQSMDDKLDKLDTTLEVTCMVEGLSKNEIDEFKSQYDVTTIEGQTKVWRLVFELDGEDWTFTGKEFQKNIKDIWEFLYDIRNIERTIQKSIKTIEDTCNNVMRQAGADVAKVESAYSYLYQKEFILENGVLSEVKKLGPSQPASTGENPAAGNNNQAQPSFSKTMNNIDDEDNDGNKKNPDNAGVARKSGRPIMDTRCQNYTNVATNMLRAKMTACEFARSECMGVIRNEVQKYIGGGTNQTPEQQPQQQQQNTAKKAR